MVLKLLQEIHLPGILLVLGESWYNLTALYCLVCFLSVSTNEGSHRAEGEEEWKTEAGHQFAVLF